MKRLTNLYEKLISKENISLALKEVIKSHRWKPGHKPDYNFFKMYFYPNEYILKIQDILDKGYVPSPYQVSRRWDNCSEKWRNIAVIPPWPDQVIHHAMIQVLQPKILQGMDYWCVGSIRGRGASRGKRGIERWLKDDKSGTQYCLSADIHHFYESLQPNIVFSFLKKIIKDRRYLDFVWSIIKDGFVIGAFYSQWFANFSLQELDRLIRQQTDVTHYVRYMDNFTIFSSSKEGLHKVQQIMVQWLNEHSLSMKKDWQIYPTSIRQPQAMGYRYSPQGTRIKKRNALRLKRQLSICKKMILAHKPIPVEMAAGLLSRLGQLKQSNSVNFYKYYVPKGLQRILKKVIKQHALYIPRWGIEPKTYI